MSTFYTLPAVGERTRLLTHLVVREDAHLLYGFATAEERTLFRNLLKVSGRRTAHRAGDPLGRHRGAALPRRCASMTRQR